MKTNLRPLLPGVVLVSVLFIVGCSTTITPVGETTIEAVPVDQVEVFYQQPQRPYEVIALVSHEPGSVFPTVADCIAKCRQAAAKAGADALIVTATYGAALGRPAKASGQAVKWKK